MAPRKKSKPTDIVGAEGVHISNGYVHEEFLVNLRGEQGRRIYRQMRDNDATIGSILFAVSMLIRSVDWEVAGEDDELVEFAENVFFADMDHTWDDFITNVLSMLVFGWQYTEVVYKKRDDGRIGIRKLADRSQETLHRWEMDENGEVLGMHQQPPNGGEIRYIPIEKALHFRPQMYKGSPEGRSVLRNAYRSWFLLKNIQDIEAIAIERELNGLPVAYIPSAILNGTDADALAAKALYLRIVRDIKFNEQGGVLLPSEPFTDAEGKPTNLRKFELQLLNARGTRSVNTDVTIKRYANDIASTVLGDITKMGQVGERGSFALGKTKFDMFAKAIEGWLDSIAAICNRFLVKPLWKLNGWNSDTEIRLIPGRVSPEDLGELGQYVERLSRAGINLADGLTEERLRSIGNLPEAPAEDSEIESTIPVEPKDEEDDLEPTD